MSDPFNNVNLLRIIQESETDADSPVSEELMSQIRENWEVLTMLMLYTGDSGTATQNPTEETLTDSGAAYDADEHNGRSLVIIDGNAAGNVYTIDDTTATTLVCTGDTMLTDGVLSGDAYKIFYNLKNTVAHTHDGVDSSKEQMCHIKVGSYTGDGTVDQGISGVGFEPQMVLVTSATDTSAKSAFLKFDGIDTTYSIDIATGMVIANAIISLDSDGFSVSDSAADAHPNKAAGSHGYVYLALG